MMATSMVPVTAMAEDQPDVVSAEETQDLSEDTETEDQGVFEEETDVQEAETEAWQKRNLKKKIPGTL